MLMAGAAMAQGTGSATIDAIVKRGEVICGTAGNSAGFSLPDSQGVMRGIDADACRSVAAAILGDAKKVKYVPLDRPGALHRAGSRARSTCSTAPPPGPSAAKATSAACSPR
jgi:ABC-type amino acid transport substrate-binding protein